jgi:EAL domain-containing protein (putative c-di-GMP-specific phosphodiesterase class I)
VQNDETLALLRSYGVEFGQGFHIGEPEPLVPTRRRPQSIELEIQPAAERRSDCG